MSDRETVDFLATVPLLEGREEADLVELARVMRRRTVREGEVLWRQGDDAREMVFVVDGAVSASLQRARRSHGGDRESRSGGGGRRDRAARRRRAHDERARDRDRDGARARPAGFRGAARRQHPSAFRLKRRLASLFTARLRNQLRHLAALARRRRRPARRPRMPPGRSPSWSTAARPTASTCVAWRPSTTSTRWRSGAS